MNDDKMNELHNYLMETLKIIIEICNKNNIKYFLTGGTLLGSIRHNGFIPWDDDIDLAMPRTEYEKFLSLSREEFPDNLEIVHYSKKNDENFKHFAKVENRSYKIIREIWGVQVKKNLFIDIFPTDNIPDGKIAGKIYELKCKIMYGKVRLSRINLGNKGKEYKLKEFLRKIDNKIHFTKNMHIEKQLEKYDKLLMKYKNKECKYQVLSIGGNGFFKEKFINNENYIQHKFEDIMLPIPADYDRYLSSTYGNNYMELPPEEKRKTKHCLDIIKEEQ